MFKEIKRNQAGEIKYVRVMLDFEESMLDLNLLVCS